MDFFPYFLFYLKNFRELEISSPESNDSGIHSDDRLNRHSNSTSIMDSLYSSVISTKKSESEINGKASNDATAQETSSDNYDEIDLDTEIVHVEQHALPLGWIRCCGNDLRIEYISLK